MIRILKVLDLEFDLLSYFSLAIKTPSKLETPFQKSNTDLIQQLHSTYTPADSSLAFSAYCAFQEGGNDLQVIIIFKISK